jgi:hypothetical protein
MTGQIFAQNQALQPNLMLMKPQQVRKASRKIHLLA